VGEEGMRFQVTHPPGCGALLCNGVRGPGDTGAGEVRPGKRHLHEGLRYRGGFRVVGALKQNSMCRQQVGLAFNVRGVCSWQLASPRLREMVTPDSGLIPW